MQNAGLDEAQAGIKTARRSINKFRYADDTTLMAESEEELKMEQRTGSKLGNEYVKAVYCHLAYLIYIHSASCKMPG